jgi:hypothetical protein
MTASPDQDHDQAPAAVEAVDPATGQLSPAVLDALAGQLDQRRAERAADAEWAKATAETCSRCGARESWLDPRRGRGGWHRDAKGAICQPCNLDMRDFQRPDGAILPDAEYRARVIAELIGPERARWQWAPLLVERAPKLLPWFCEVPGARPGDGPERFAYVDVEDLAASLKAKPPPPAPRLSRGRRHRCAGCGCRGECWWAEQVAVSAPTTSTGELSRAVRAHFRIRWTCATCRHVDVEQRAEQLPGVPVRGLVGG